jgi:hypothetical protein
MAFEGGTAARYYRACGWAVSGAESVFETTNKIAGQQRPARIADVIVLHS